MTFTIHGVGAGRGIAIGRAVVIRSSWASVGHHLIHADQVSAELNVLAQARAAVIADIQHSLAALGADAPTELPALLEVHLMLLQDEDLFASVSAWIGERHYNAAWALAAQYDRLARQFDEMDDPYLRARKADLEQVLGRVIQHVQGQTTALPSGTEEGAVILVAHDLSPADMLQLRDSHLRGFITDAGGQTSHTAIVARSMGIPAVVGARMASHLIQQDDTLIIDAQAGILVVNPDEAALAEYTRRHQQDEQERTRLSRLLHTPSITRDGHKIELLANIELPGDTAAAVAAGAVGVGLFRSEFLFMGRKSSPTHPANVVSHVGHAGHVANAASVTTASPTPAQQQPSPPPPLPASPQLPDEEEQYQAYLQALHGMQGLPITIRTIDIGADKPLDATAMGPAHLNPALGRRAIRWSLSEPDMFLTQLRAVLRCAAHGRVGLLIPMLGQVSEIHQTLHMLDTARQQLDARGAVYGDVLLGAMVEVPAAAIIARTFLQYFDFLSIGTNDLIQYTLAIDRTDETVAHLFDPTHPAVLQLIAQTLRAGHEAGKPVSICGEMAGDPTFTRLLLGLGLRHFSMHPAQILAVKQEIIQANVSQLSGWAQQVLHSPHPAQMLQAKQA